MTIEGTSCKCSLGAFGEGPCPCKGCGAVGENVWIGEVDELCARCRKEGSKMTQTLTVYQTPELSIVPQDAAKNQAQSHAEWLQQWIAPEAQLFEIENQEALEMATQVLQEIKSRSKEIEEAEKTFTRPLQDVLGKLRAVFAPARAMATQAEVLWKKKILDSNEKRRLAAAEAAKQVQAALSAGNTQAAIVAHAKIQPVEKVAGIQTRRIWEVKRINQDLLLPEYLTPDVAKIKAEMRAQVKAGQEPVIAGVTFELVESLAVTG